MVLSLEGKLSKWSRLLLSAGLFSTVFMLQMVEDHSLGQKKRRQTTEEFCFSVVCEHSSICLKPGAECLLVLALDTVVRRLLLYSAFSPDSAGFN